MHCLLIFQTLLLTQKINMRAEKEEGRIQDTVCQDHLIGKLMFNCQSLRVASQKTRKSQDSLGKSHENEMKYSFLPDLLRYFHCAKSSCCLF